MGIVKYTHIVNEVLQMSNVSYGRLLNGGVRAICGANGWNVKAVYNDKTSKGRNLKYAGFQCSEDKRQAIMTKVMAYISEKKIPNVVSVRWFVPDSFYFDFKLVIEISE